MFHSLMTIIRELYLYLSVVIFMLKHWVKLHRYILVYLVMWQHVCNGTVCFKLMQGMNKYKYGLQKYANRQVAM
jgi:hypothetical protein